MDLCYLLRLFYLFLKVTDLHKKFSELSALTRPVDNDIIRYESSAEVFGPFGVDLEEGEKVGKDIEKVLQSVEKTYEKLDAVKELASSIDENLEEYGVEGNVVQFSVRDRKKHLDELKDMYEKRKEGVESQVIELKEFLNESSKVESWAAAIQGEVDKTDVTDDEPEHVEKQLNEIEVW